MLGNRKMERPDPVDLMASQDKAWEAERNTGAIRLLVICFNVATWYLFLDGGGIPWLAAAISVVAVVYGVVVVVAEPYRRVPVLRAAMFTAVTDAALITLWILATGVFASPYYLLWYLSLIAVAFRFEPKVSWLATCLYSVCYVAIVALAGQFEDNLVQLTIRVMYIALCGALGALLAHATAEVFRERVDLTRHVQAERQAQAAKELERLREMDRFKTDFINTAAHELNTPLTPIKLQLLMLKRRVPEGTEDRKAVDMLDRNLERLSLLVGDMLDVARLQAGRLRLEPKATDLAKLLVEACDTFADSAYARHVTLDLDAQGPLLAQVDGKRITQVVYNLVSNALKFTPADGRVTVRGKNDGGQVRITVTDTGVGLAPDQAAQLFRPFTQLHRHQIQAPGTGLGLYISAGIVERHGGTISCTSPGVGQGATFTVLLPAAGTPPPEPPAPSGAPRDVAGFM
ncbi:MAG: hypothetical protein QOD77_449 [Thermoplasmata archaeon]|nr:hypothetical protein [Thermoplasmata archaeon]